METKGIFNQNGSSSLIEEKIINDDFQDLSDFSKHMDCIPSSFPKRIEADPDNVESGLAKLVLTLIEIIRKLLEKQAIRRVESQTLSEEEIERLGLTLMKLEGKMEELKEYFGLTNDDLTIDLGPLGEIE